MSYSKAQLETVKQTTPTVKQFEFDLEDADWSYEPGQHTVLRFEKEGETVERPYTMINLDGTSKFCLAIKKYEDGTATPWIHERQPGDEIEFEEPSGNLSIRDLSRDIVLISTGTGATPMYAMLRHYLKEGEGTVHYMHGEKSTDTILFKQELSQLDSENPELEVTYSLSDEDWRGRQGFIQEHIEDVLESTDEKDFYICGVPQMVVDTEQKLKDLGVDEENIITEGWESDAVE
jgi:ferredoxin-NADP reductase